MKIGVIGAGKIGATAARLFADAGHEVWLANSRGREAVAAAARDAGATPGSLEEAAGAGDLVLIAIPFGRIRELPATALAGRIVIDANNYYPARDGNIAELDDDSTTSSELLAQHLSGARIVKAFNTIYFKHLAEHGHPDGPREQRRAILICGDDSDAKSAVSALIEELGFAAVDTGSLAQGGRLQQPGAALYNANVTAEQAEAHLTGRDGAPYQKQ